MPLQENPYVVLIGDVGIGKSTLAEKLTGHRGMSSDSSTSFTRRALHFRSPRLQLCDTPGSNPMKDRFEHNCWIAEAMSVRPVSCLLIVAEAHRRMNNTIEEIVKYAKAFQPKQFEGILAACVTHMDTVSWSEKEFQRNLIEQTGFSKVIFSQPNKQPKALEDDILSVCSHEPAPIFIESENFLQFFRIDDQVLKVLNSVSKEVQHFEKMKSEFFLAFPALASANTDLSKTAPKDVDALFEFQAWMTTCITEAQKRVAKENDFTFDGSSVLNEAGHIANLTNQLKTVLLDVRMTCLRFTQSGVDEMRKCPHCGLIWTKVVGCNGQTTCGNLVNEVDSKRGSGIMATFSFWCDWSLGKLNIRHSGERRAKKYELGNRRGVGCGRSINWSAMQIVGVPAEFYATQKVHVDDVASLPSEVAPSWHSAFEEARSKMIIREGSSVEADQDAEDEAGAAAATSRESSYYRMQKAAYAMDGFAS